MNNLSIFNEPCAPALTRPLEFSFDIFKLTMARKEGEEAGMVKLFVNSRAYVLIVVVGKLYPRT